MSPILSIVIVSEVIFTLFIVWGFMHEDRFVAFEDKIIRAVLRKIRKNKASREILRRERLNSEFAYTPVKPEAARRVNSDSAA